MKIEVFTLNYLLSANGWISPSDSVMMMTVTKLFDHTSRPWRNLKGWCNSWNITNREYEGCSFLDEESGKTQPCWVSAQPLHNSCPWKDPDHNRETGGTCSLTLLKQALFLSYLKKEWFKAAFTLIYPPFHYLLYFLTCDYCFLQQASIETSAYL